MTRFRKIKEEALYTTFIRDITAEVLEKGLYTNKALKKVMKRHVISNLWHLDEVNIILVLLSTMSYFTPANGMI